MDADDDSLYDVTEEDSHLFASREFEEYLQSLEGEDERIAPRSAYTARSPGTPQRAPSSHNRTSAIQTLLSLGSQLFSPSTQRAMASAPVVNQFSAYPSLPSPPRTPSPTMPGSFRLYREVDELDSPPVILRNSQNVPPALLSPPSSGQAGAKDESQLVARASREAITATPHLSQRTSQLSINPQRRIVGTRLFSSAAASPAVVTEERNRGLAPPPRTKRAFQTIEEDEEQPYLQETPSERASQRPRLMSDIVPPRYGVSTRDPSILHKPQPQSHPIQVHSSRLHDVLRELPWSFRYSICSFVSTGMIDWDSIELDKLRAILRQNPTRTTYNVDIGGTAHEFLPQDKRSEVPVSNKGLLSALDDEERILASSQRTRESGQIEWPAGHVRFSAVLERRGGPKEAPELKLVLRPPSLAVNNSNRFTRKLGSCAVLSVTIEDSLLRQADVSYLYDSIAHGLLIDGEVFHAICAKDGSVTFVSGMTAPYLGLRAMTSDEFWLWFVTWHNDWRLEHNQSMTKWGARMQLGLSDSVPGPTLECDHILFEPDIISPAWDGEGKPPSEMIMTDGAGYMSNQIALYIQKTYGLRHPPAAVQIRIAGAKGLLVVCPANYENGTLRVWIRPSQIKSFLMKQHLNDPSLRTIDTLRPSDYTTPSHITAQLLINLHENHVPALLLCDLFAASLEAAAQPFLKYASQEDRLALCKSIESECRLVTVRLSRSGLLLRGRETTALRSDLTTPHFPPTIEEAAYCSLQAGFSHASNQHVNEKVKFILKSVISQYVEGFKFPLDQSLDALIIPDPCGILAEGEIAFYFPDAFQEPEGMMIDCLTRDVLIYRHPGVLPTDAQKVRAVDKDVLRKWKGVIMVSTRGSRSLASLLSGGDYDGDRAIIIWDERIVSPFQNAPLDQASPPPGFQENIRKVGESVDEFESRTCALDIKAQRRELQKYLLAGMKSDFIMQRYSHLHDVATAAYGLHDSRSIDLAHKYCIALDSFKSGLKIESKIYQQDIRRYDRLHPWKVEKLTATNRLELKREAPGTFIIHELQARGEKTKAILIRQFESIYMLENPRMGWKDPALTEPWEEFQDRASRGPPSMQASCRSIEDHVKAVFEKYNVLKRGIAGHMESQRMVPADRSSVRTEYNTQLAKIRQHFWAGMAACNVDSCMSPRELRAILASCAHVIGEKKMSFAFDVAFWDIMRLKADSVKPFSQDQAEMEVGRMHPAPTVSRPAFWMTTLNSRLVGRLTHSFGRAQTS